MAADVKRKVAIEVVTNTAKAKKGLSSLGKVAAGVAAGGLFAVGYAALEGIKAFREEEQIVRNFSRTVKNMGIPVAQATAAMDKMAQRALDLGFDDAETIQGMDTFIRQTGSLEKSTRLMALAWDIARSKEIPLTEAIKQAQAIYNGSARTLKQYGIEGKKGMEAVAEARRIERGKAREWARNHPMQKRLGDLKDAWADLVGNLAKGDFSGVQAAVGKLGRLIEKTLFGWTNGKGQHVSGLVDRVGQWGKDIADGILKGIGEVNWGAKLGEVLDAGLLALKEAIDNDTLKNLAVVGTALAGGIFLAKFFLDAALLVFNAPLWAAKTTVGLAVTAIGNLLGGIFTVAMWTGKEAIGLLKGGAAWAFGQMGKAKGALAVAASGLGSSMGGIFITAFAGALVGIAAKNIILDKLSELFRSVGVPEDAISEGRKAAGFGNPLQMLEDLINGRHATGTAGARKGWSWVGERGPELVRFRGGEQVKDAASSARMVGGAVNVNISVNAPVAADGARVGQDIAAYLDRFFARGGRFRYAPAGGTR